MQTVLAEDIPAIPLYYTTSYDAWRISKYDGWMNMYDHHARTHSILSYLERGWNCRKKMIKKMILINLVECWKKATGDALNILDEGGMAEFWNKRSENYANNIDKGKRKKKTDEILKFLEESGFNPEGSRVLDIGCGPGTLSLPLARLGAEVTALDISSGMLDRLKDSIKKESLPIEVIECSWWTADINELGFRGTNMTL